MRTAKIHESEMIDRLYLELSQVTSATTAKEIKLAEANKILTNTIGLLLSKQRELCAAIESLPAGEQQTQISIMASHVSFQMQELLRQSGSAPFVPIKIECHI